MTQKLRQVAKPILLEDIIQDWRKIERGPKPRLSPIQLFSALHFITEHGPLGRYDLADKIHENQGVIRGLLERLLENRLIESSKAGARITAEGRKVLNAFLKAHRIADLKVAKLPSVIQARYTYASHLRRAGNRASRVIEQRDTAVRMGASGAMTILCTRQGLTIPPDNENLRKHYPEAADALESIFPVKDGDVILLAFAEDEYAALAGVLAVSLLVAA